MKRTISQKIKKYVSAILAAAMSLSLFTAIPVSADIGRTTYNYDGYSVDYNVTNEWDGAQTVELTVSNTGTDSILNWALKYDAEGKISNLWNADLYEQNGDEYVIKNVGWNFEIAPSQSVTYGYTLSGDNISMPKNFEIYSKRVDKAEGYDVQYNITKSWDVGVEGNIVITNTSAAPIEAWTLSFDSNFTIDNLWNGRVLENNGTSYTVAAEMWTNPVQPNSSMTIGFVGSKAADVEALLSNFRLTEVVIGEGMPVIPIDPPAEEIEITANAVYDEESGNISVSWTSNKQDGTFDILMSNDGENFVSIGTVEGVSEFVYTPESDFETLFFKVVQTIGEQIAESNVVAVAKSMEDIAISAEATYDEESGVITISWNTNKDGGDFEIFMSKDGETYTSVGTVENKSEFSYTPEDEFETLYFKVKQTLDKKTAESNVSEVNFYIDWEDETDTDNDGLTDVYEKYQYKTDPTNPDTDGDGLPDGYEVYYLGTDPTKADTDDNGITDGDEDFDKDGLSNIEEYRLGTAPIVKDSDNDGLSDGEEVNIHNTDPLVYDSDSDGICDGDEIIKGLNPNNPATFGVPDSEYTFEQTLTADNVVFNLINYDENPFELSLKLNAAGNAENSIAVSKSGYSIIMDNDSILGCVPEIYYNKNLKVDNIEISFDISQKYLIEPYSASDNELTGLHKYNIFTYNEDLNMLMPIATEYDEANHRIYTNVESVGTYFIVDMNEWVSQLGIKSNSEPVRMAAYSLSENSDEESEYIDVAFLLYHNQTYSNVIKSELKKTVEQMYSNYDNIRVFFVVYSGDAYVCGLTGNKYAESVEEANNIINRMFYTPDISNLTMVNGFKGVSNLEWRENSQRHCFVIDVLVEPMCKYDMPAFTNLAEMNISTAICYGSANSNAAIYKAMTPNTYANVVVIDRFLIPLIKFPEKDGMIMSTNLLPVKLNKDIKKDYVDAAADLYYNEDKRESYSDFADTDNDGLYDFEEINFDTDLISFKDNDKVKLPTFAECLASTNNAKIVTAMDIYADKSFYEEAMDKSILLVNSDPTSEDGDGDGILDFDEVKIIKEELRNGVSEISTFAETNDNNFDTNGINVYASKKIEIPNVPKNKFVNRPINPIFENTVENHYGNLKSRENNSDNPIYVHADKNVINIDIRMDFQYYDKNNNSIESKKIMLLNEDGHLEYYDAEKIIKEGIKERWETSFVGSKYDFYKGMNIKVKVNFVDVDTTSSGCITYKLYDDNAIDVKGGKLVSYTVNEGDDNLFNWNRNLNKITYLYTGDHGITTYSLEQYKGVAAHELGHSLGLEDAYAYTKPRHYSSAKIKILSGILPSSIDISNDSVNENSEIWCNGKSKLHTYDCGEIMLYSGHALPNDIEMVIFAFTTNIYQKFNQCNLYYNDNKKNYVSAAIKDKKNNVIIYYVEVESNKTYIRYQKYEFKIFEKQPHVVDIDDSKRIFNEKVINLKSVTIEEVEQDYKTFSKKK